MNSQYQIVRTNQQLNDLLNVLSSSPTVALDLETTGLEVDDSNVIVGWALSVGAGTGWYIPVRHLSLLATGEWVSDIKTQLLPELVAQELKPLLESRDKVLIHNAKFDTHFTEREGIFIDKDQIDDTMLEASVAGYFDKLDRVGLKEISSKVFGHKQVKFEELFDKGTKAKDRNIAKVDSDVAGYYACEDADFCFRVHDRYSDYLAAHGDLEFVYKLEKALWPVVRNIEDMGFKVSQEFCEGAVEFLRQEAAALYRIIIDQIKLELIKRCMSSGKAVTWDETAYNLPPKKKGEPYADWLVGFNPDSDAQLRDVLFDVLGYKPILETARGKPSTGKLTLDRIGRDSNIARNIETYKSILDAVIKLRKEILGNSRRDGRVHTSYNQVGTRTGRFSSNSPNIQNIAREKSWTVIDVNNNEREIKISPRDSLVPEKDYYLVETDFSAIEFILMAYFSGAKSIVRNYESGTIDVHKETASLMFNIPYDQVDDEQRTRAKTCNYLVIYGGSGAALSLRTGQTRWEAEKEVARFFEVRPEFKKYIQKTTSEAKRDFTINTFFGRVIYVPELESPVFSVRGHGERSAANAKIQSCAADYHKKGLVISSWRVGEKYPRDLARMVAQTHDSQTWEVHRSIPPSEIVPIITKAMITSDPDLPKIKVDAKIGVSWGSTVKGWETAADFGTLLTQLDADYAKKIQNFGNLPNTLEDLQLPLAIPDGVRLKVVLGHELFWQEFDRLCSLLKANPGKNTIELVFPGGRSVLGTGQTTRLSAKTLQDYLTPFLPSVKVTVDREAMLESVAEILK